MASSKAFWTDMRHLRRKPTGRRPRSHDPFRAAMEGAGRCSVFVRAEDVRGDARVADRGRRLEVAERDRDLPIRVEALDVVHTVRTHLDVDQAPERTALDAMRRQVEGVGLVRDHRERERHDRVETLDSRDDRTIRPTVAAQPSIAPRLTATHERY